MQRATRQRNRLVNVTAEKICNIINVDIIRGNSTYGLDKLYNTSFFHSCMKYKYIFLHPKHIGVEYVLWHEIGHAVDYHLHYMPSICYDTKIHAETVANIFAHRYCPTFTWMNTYNKMSNPYNWPINKSIIKQRVRNIDKFMESFK
jgi:hypothetical protein